MMVIVAMLAGISGAGKNARLRTAFRRSLACLLSAAFFAGSSHAVDLHIYGGGGGGGGSYDGADAAQGGRTGTQADGWDGGGSGAVVAAGSGGGGGGGAAFIGGSLPSNTTPYQGADAAAAEGGKGGASGAGNGGLGGSGVADADKKIYIDGASGVNVTSQDAGAGGIAVPVTDYPDGKYGGAAGGAGGGGGGKGYNQTHLDAVYGGGGGGGGGTAGLWSNASGTYGTMQIVGGGGGEGGLGGGGGGGNAMLHDGGATIAVTGNMTVAGGDGGDGGSSNLGVRALGSGGGGGGGGAGTFKYGDNALTVGGALTLAGGAGGDAGSYGDGYGGNGGGGGNSLMSMGKGTLTVNGAIVLAGGDGGVSGNLTHDNERGGQGGGVSFTASGIVAGGDVTLTAGDGGSAGLGAPSAQTATVGKGGSVTFGATSLAAAGDVKIASGAMGRTVLTTAGEVDFKVSGLVEAKSVAVEQVDGAVKVDIGTLRTDTASFTSNTENGTGTSGGYSAKVGRLDLTTAADAAVPRDVTVNLAKNGSNLQSSVLDVTDMLWRGTNLTINDDGNATMTVQNIRVSGIGSSYSGGANNYAFHTAGVNVVFDVTDVAAGTTMLTVNGGSIFNVDGANLDVDFNGRPGLGVGDTITLIDNANSAVGVSKAVMKEYGATEYNFLMTFVEDGINPGYGDLVLEHTSKSLNLNKASSYFHGSASRYAILTTASDLIIDQGIPLAVGSTSSAIPNNYGPAFYAATSYTKQRYDLGSHVDSGNLNLVVGAAFLRCAGSIRTYFGPFIEGGWGDYISKNKNLANTLKAEGDAYNVGGGFLARVESETGLYLEGSLKGGWVYSDYASDDLGIGTAEYDSSTWYYGGHIGLGYDFEINECNRVAAYGTAIYTRQARDSVWNNMEEKIEFDQVESLRSRLGFRYTHTLVEDTRIYLGGAWEREYKGKIGGRVQGIRLSDAPTTEGDTGIAEIGAKWRSRTCGWELDLSVRGYFGERSGLSGSIGIGNVF